MGTVCLSLAPILRCQSLTRTESVALIIPAFLEAFFSVALVFAKRGSSRLHLLLVAEGLVYFLLAGLDLSFHLAPAVRNSFRVFQALDIFIGSLSFLPLFLYTFYLFLLGRDDLFPALPRRIFSIAKFTLLLFIPIIVVVNELGSFISLSYRVFGGPTSQPIIGVGFMNATLKLFLDSFVLVLLVMYQAFFFGMAFYRLVKAFIGQRDIESMNGTDRATHLVNGVGWIAIGVKLGAIESIIGFAQGGFGEAITRRALRFLGRACLIIGIVKGMDTVEDFRFSLDMKRDYKRRSAFRDLISNPRFSTFRQVGGYDQGLYERDSVAVTFNALTLPSKEPPPPRAVSSTTQLTSRTTSSFIYRSLAQPYPRSASPSAPTTYTRTTNSSGRVTISYSRGRAPTLEMRRISDVDIMTPVTTAGTKTFPFDRHDANHAHSKSTPIFTPFSHTSPGVAAPASALLPEEYRRNLTNRNTFGGTAEYSPRRTHRDSRQLPRQSTVSNDSQADSLEIVHYLAMQFPGLPPRQNHRPVSGRSLQTTVEQDEPSDRPSLMTRSNTTRSLDSRASAPSTPGGSLVRRSSSTKRKPVPPIDDPALAKPPTPAPQIEEVKRRQKLVVDIPPLPSSLPKAIKRLSAISNSSYLTYPHVRRHTAPNKPVDVPPRERNEQNRPTSDDTLEFPWVARGASVTVDSDAALEAAWKQTGVPRIKSVGRAPRRLTPTPTNSSFSTRESVVAEWDNISRDSKEKGTTTLVAAVVEDDEQDAASVVSSVTVRSTRYFPDGRGVKEGQSFFL